MLADAARKLTNNLPDDALVLDVGGWNDPFTRADWIIDLMPYETRGARDSASRFTESTWVQRDICEHTPWPFADGQFDFAVCTHTLEDVRDPVWVCAELSRVASGGYVEVPSRLEEQTWGVNGEWAGWSHHHWLVDLTPGVARFTLKPHFLHARPDLQIAAESLRAMDPTARISGSYWKDEIRGEEVIHYHAEELEEYLRAPIVAAGIPSRQDVRTGLMARLRSALGSAG